MARRRPPFSQQPDGLGALGPGLAPLLADVFEPRLGLAPRRRRPLLARATAAAAAAPSAASAASAATSAAPATTLSDCASHEQHHKPNGSLCRPIQTPALAPQRCSVCRRSRCNVESLPCSNGCRGQRRSRHRLWRAGSPSRLETRAFIHLRSYFGELIASRAAARPPPWHRRTPAAPQNAALHQTATPKVRACDDKCLGIEFLGLHAPHRCALPHVSARRSTLNAVYRLTGLPVARGAARGSPCPRDIVDAPRSANRPARDRKRRSQGQWNVADVVAAEARASTRLRFSGVDGLRAVRVDRASRRLAGPATRARATAGRAVGSLAGAGHLRARRVASRA